MHNPAHRNGYYGFWDAARRRGHGGRAAYHWEEIARVCVLNSWGFTAQECSSMSRVRIEPVRKVLAGTQWTHVSRHLGIIPELKSQRKRRQTGAWCVRALVILFYFILNMCLLTGFD